MVQGYDESGRRRILLPEGSDCCMENVTSVVTWDQLIQLGLGLIGILDILVHIYFFIHNNKKK